MFEHFLGEVVVLDMQSSYVFIGTLTEIDHRYLGLSQVDVHDLRDSSTTREVYVHEIRVHGLAPNRTRAIVQRDQIVSLSRLDEVHS